MIRKFQLVSLCVAATAVVGYGQAVPAATAPDPYSSFALPEVGGSLRYALTASESILTGYNGSTGSGVSAYTNLSGELAYLSRSDKHPFSAVYSGGYLFGTSTFPSYAYQTLSLSQELHTRKWDFLVGDTVSYLPQTPIGSLSGVPGAGDLSLPAIQVNTAPGLDILTTYATRVSNTVSGTATRQFTASTGLSLTGADLVQRYTGSSTGFQGIDNDQQTAAATLQHRLNDRTTVAGAYQFTNSSFSSSLLEAGNYGFQTHSAQVSFTRRLGPTLYISAGAGPQWFVPGGNSDLASGTSVSVAANAQLSYEKQRLRASIGYVRGVSNGNGVVIGSRLDAVVGNVSRTFGRIFNVGGVVGYNRSEPLSNTLLPTFNSSGVIAGGQFSAQVRRPISVFAGYTVQHQSFDGYAPAGIAFNGLTQYVSFGVTYSPKPFYRRR